MTQEELNKKEEEKEQKKQENKRNATNNAQALRIAANVASNSPDPYVGTVAKAVVAADKLTGGKSTELAGHALNQANKLNPLKKPMQGLINKSVESGAAQTAGTIASKKIDANNATQAADAAKKAEEAKKTADAAKKTAEAKKEISNAQGSTHNQNTKTTNTQKPVSQEKKEEEKSKTPVLVIVIVALVALPIIGVLALPLILVGFLSPISDYEPKSISDYRTITIQNSENSIYNGEYDLEEYIAGVVAAENSPIDNLEYYKYRATEIRTLFLINADSDIVSIGSNDMGFIPVDESPHKDTIKQAVEETSGMIAMSEETLKFKAISSKVVNQDENNYYIEYSTPMTEGTKTLTIPKNWEHISTYLTSLDNSYKDTISSNDYSINDIMTLYLTTSKNYKYEDIFKEYYDKTSVVNINIGVTGEVVNGFITPLESYNCAGGYGCRYHPIDKVYKIHSGIDLGATSGSLVYATKSGEITHVTSNVPGYSSAQSYGNYITIKHDDGSQTRYAHLLYGSIPNTIYVGARVTQGQIIGKVGSTGKSTGPHLHYEIFIDGSRVNPYFYMDLSKAKNDTAQCNSNANVPMSNCGY